jgi:hypothetical protein
LIRFDDQEEAELNQRGIERKKNFRGNVLFVNGNEENVGRHGAGRRRGISPKIHSI